MRIIKLSSDDVELKTREAVDEFFQGGLRAKEPPGKFSLKGALKCKIGENGVAAGEGLVFTYKGECVYKARSNSSREKNRGADNKVYPHYFLVDIASIEAIQGTLTQIQEKLEQEDLRLKYDLARVQAWPRFQDDDPDDNRKAQIIEAFVSGEESAVDKLEKEQAAGQGFLLDKKLRGALEQHAMAAAKKHFTDLQYVCEDHSMNQPYDLYCRRAKEVLYVEVKGTQTDGEKIILTNGEVEFARRNKGRMALFVLHSIKKSEVTEECNGGELMLIEPWNADDGWLTPISFTYRIPPCQLEQEGRPSRRRRASNSTV